MPIARLNLTLRLLDAALFVLVSLALCASALGQSAGWKENVGGTVSTKRSIACNQDELLAALIAAEREFVPLQLGIRADGGINGLVLSTGDYFVGHHVYKSPLPYQSDLYDLSSGVTLRNITQVPGTLEANWADASPKALRAEAERREQEIVRARKELAEQVEKETRREAAAVQIRQVPRNCGALK
jgi:hypothetical protein